MGLRGVAQKLSFCYTVSSNILGSIDSYRNYLAYSLVNSNVLTAGSVFLPIAANDDLTDGLFPPIPASVFELTTWYLSVVNWYSSYSISPSKYAKKEVGSFSAL